MGEAVRSRREQQRDQVRAAVTEERLRIARELHDVVAHSMSLIAVQAGVGAHVIRTDPAAAEQSLEVIADTSRKALEQTRSMLGMLREETEDGTRPPTQGLDDLPALVDDVRAAGLEVELVRSGTAHELDAAVSLAAYRDRPGVAHQRHQALRGRRRRTVTVAVSDADGSTSRSAIPARPGRATERGSGHGLVGLDERVRLVGGALAYGADGDGFRVHADPAEQGPTDDPGRGRRRPGPGAGRVRAAAAARPTASRSSARRATGWRRSPCAGVRRPTWC